MTDEGIPRLNHVAISVPRELLSDESSARLLDFYGEVFGWDEMPTMRKPDELLVLRLHSNEQFVYLHGSPKPLTCPKEDHFGLSLQTPADLDAVLDRARRYAERDPEVEISERLAEDFKVLTLHSVYIRYWLPLRIELQCFEWSPEISEAQKRPGAAG